MCTFLCVYMCVDLHVCNSVHMCVFAYMNVCVFVWIDVCLYAFNVRVRACVFVCTVRMHVCACAGPGPGICVHVLLTLNPASKHACGVLNAWKIASFLKSTEKRHELKSQ